MAANDHARLGQLEAERYTIQNKLSSVRTRLKGNPSPEKRREYEERKAALTAERDRLGAEIKKIKS